MTRIFFGILLIILGISALTGVPFFKFFFALLFIYIGIRILIGNRPVIRYHSTEDSGPTPTEEDAINEVVIMSGIRKTIRSEAFKGGKVVAIFSGAELNLAGAKTNEKELALELVAILGGIKLIVPKEWKVVLESTAIAGGYDNKTSPHNHHVTLRVQGTAILGGVEIVNE